MTTNPRSSTDTVRRDLLASGHKGHVLRPAHAPGQGEGGGLCGRDLSTRTLGFRQPSAKQIRVLHFEETFGLHGLKTGPTSVCTFKPTLKFDAGAREPVQHAGGRCATAVLTQATSGRFPPFFEFFLHWA